MNFGNWLKLTFMRFAEGFKDQPVPQFERLEPRLLLNADFDIGPTLREFPDFSSKPTLFIMTRTLYHNRVRR